MRGQWIAASFVCTVLVSGCGGENPAPKKLEAVDLSRYPAWVVSPRMEGYITAVGQAKPQKRGIEAQRRIALLSAKAELGKQLGVFVDSELFRKSVCTTETCQNDIKSFSDQYSRQRLEHIEIKEEWRDPKTGDLYIRVATPQGE